MKGKKGNSRVGMKVSGNPDVFREAEEKKKGGRAKRASGGKVVGPITGANVRPRLDRPGRKMGGRVGADKSPLSTANRTTSAESTPKTQEGGMSS